MRGFLRKITKRDFSEKPLVHDVIGSLKEIIYKIVKNDKLIDGIVPVSITVDSVFLYISFIIKAAE